MTQNSLKLSGLKYHSSLWSYLLTMSMLNYNNYSDKLVWNLEIKRQIDSRLILLRFIMTCGDRSLCSITESSSCLNIITLPLCNFTYELAWDPSNRSIQRTPHRNLSCAMDSVKCNLQVHPIMDTEGTS